MLDLLGLDETTLAAYRQWLRRETMTVEEVGAALGQPAATVRRARDRLVELALLLPSEEHPGQFVAVHPEPALDQLFRQQHDQIARRHEQLARARSQVGTLVADYARGRRPVPSGVEVERLAGRDAFRAGLLTLVNSAETEVLSIRGRPGDLLAELLPVELRALARGVAVRTVQPPVDGDTRLLAYHDAAAGRGVGFRVVDPVPVEVTVADGQRALLPVRAAGGADPEALLISGAPLARLAVVLFETLWREAQPPARSAPRVTGPRPAPAGVAAQPDAQERALLALLALGTKDEAAARHLGVSVRTVRRMIADLMQRLDARSRFQAGVIAAQRGWL